MNKRFTKVVGKVSVEYINNGSSSEVIIRKDNDFVLCWGSANDEMVQLVKDKINFFNYTKGAKSHYSRALLLVLAELAK